MAKFQFSKCIWCWAICAMLVVAGVVAINKVLS